MIVLTALNCHSAWSGGGVGSLAMTRTGRTGVLARVCPAPASAGPVSGGLLLGGAVDAAAAFSQVVDGQRDHLAARVEIADQPAGGIVGARVADPAAQPPESRPAKRELAPAPNSLLGAGAFS